MRAGISRLGGHPRFYDIDGEAFVVGMDRTLDEFDSRRRMLALGIAALKECLAELPVSQGVAVPVFIGVRDAALGFTKADSEWLASGLSRAVESRCKAQVRVVTGGSAAGLVAVQQARLVVESGAVQLAIAGGIDSHLDPVFLERLDEAGRCKSVGNKWGFPPGEGAGMLAICSSSVARAIRRPSLADIVSDGIAIEPAFYGSDLVCTGEVLTSAIHDALGCLSWPSEAVATTYCDINGEFHRTEEFMYATQRLPANAFRAVETFVAPADCWGDVGAASGPLFAALAIESGRRGYSKGPYALLWAASDSGQRAALLLRIP
ncbi:MAG: beta-ketoacyl synthase N-terminal-like domain-containing protein [Nannocystales bacterium]